MKTTNSVWMGAALAAQGAWAASASLSVSLSDSIRPVTHCASGSLYGITETLPSDVAGMIAPLRPHAFNQPAMAGSGRQQPIGGAIKVSERIAATTGKVQLRLADVYPGWPYKWVSSADFKTQITNVINARKASGRDNYDGYEIWNEPDGTWQSANGDFYANCWKPAYDLIRSLDPQAKIIGPSYSYYNNNSMKSFLTSCKNGNALPDVVSWHQWGSDGFAGNVQTYRALETSLGISPRGLSINEYSSGTHTLEGCPGVSVPFIAKFERHGVESAMISWWFTGLPGRLGSLLTSTNQKGGGWHLYKWYGDMDGYMAKTVPPNDKSDGVDAFAAVDKAQRCASIVLGGNSVGTVNVAVSGIPAWMGSSVNVKVEQVTWSNKDTPVDGPTTVSTTKYDVVNGSFSVPVNVVSAFYAYRVYVTPTNTGLAREGGSSAPGSDLYRLRDLRGRDLGTLGLREGESLESALARAVSRPGVYLALPAAQGAARRVVVAGP